MKIIENMEEKKRLLDQTYYNNYLLELEKRNNKYFNKVINEKLVVRTDDNYYIIINIEKPTIHKDLWVDDEKEIPEKTEQFFIKYNLIFNGRLESNTKDNMFIYSPYENTTENLVIASNDGYSRAVGDNTFKRFLTKEEQAFIQRIYKNLLNDYIERLKKYFKRYNDKIYCRGYWVNR